MFKKCNFLIIIFLSQIATLLVFRVDDIIKTFHFAVFFQTTTFEMKRCLFSAYYFPVFFSNCNVWNTSLLVFRVSFSCTCSNRNVWNTSLLVWCYQTFSRTFSKTNSFSSQNLFFTSFIFYLFLLQNVPILQHAIASKSNHSNTMLPNVMVLAPLQKLKIKYEFSYQSTTRLKYIDIGLGAIRAKFGPTSDVDKIFSKMYSQYVLFRNKYS
jgi:hypothetical protein